MRNKHVILIALFLISLKITHAQNFRDDIAVVINILGFNNDLDQKYIEGLRASMYAYFTTELEKNEFFRVVNRDNTDESVGDMGKIIQGNPGLSFWVNYTEKLKEQSKGIGANALILIDVFVYKNKESKKDEYQFRFKIIQTETNWLNTFIIKRDMKTYTKKDDQKPDKFKGRFRDMLRSVRDEMMEKIDEVWNTSFVIANAKGNKLTVNPTSVFPINKSMSQRINWFEWEEHNIGGQSYLEVRSLGDSKINGLVDGSISVTTKRDFSKHDLQKIWGTIKPNYVLNHSGTFFVSFVELPIDYGNNGIVNFNINSCIYNAFEDLPKYSLYQISSKELVYAEKEIQKREEYINGETVNQYNARKSDYIIIAKNLGSNNDQYKVNLDFISTSTGEILKETVIESSASMFSSEVSNWLYPHIMLPCRVELNGKKVSIYTHLRTTIKSNFKYQIIEMREVKLGNSTETVRVPMAKLKFKEQFGQKIIFDVEEILENDFKKVKNSKEYYLMAY